MRINLRFYDFVRDGEQKKGFYRNQSHRERNRGNFDGFRCEIHFLLKKI